VSCKYNIWVKVVCLHTPSGPQGKITSQAKAAC